MSRGSLAEQVLGITNPSDIEQSLNQAHQTLTGEPRNPHDPVSNPDGSFTVLESWWHGLTYDQQERYQAATMVHEIVVGRRVKTASTLASWMSYRSMMHRYGTKGNGSATALLIGAQTAVSSRSFQCLAQDEYGAGTAMVVDLVAGKDKALHGLFVQASGLDLPFADASVDFVHTNQLIHMLKDPSSPDAPLSYKVRKLVREVARVLAPGGQLLMTERVPGGQYNTPPVSESLEAVFHSRKLATFVGSALSQQGVEFVKTAPAEVFRNEEFLFDRSRDFDRYAKSITSLAFTVYAQKRPHRPVIAL